MEGGVLTLARPCLPHPKLVVQPRNLNEGFAHGGLNSATPTPMAFFSSSFADQDFSRGSKPLSHLLAEGLSSPVFTPTAFFNNFVNISSGSTDTPACSNADEKPERNESDVKGLTYNDSQSKSSGGYKSMMPSRLPIASSSMHFGISAGISPASLESPILFSMRQADPSPTTGSLSLQHGTLGRQLQVNVSQHEDRWATSESNDSFIFKPYPLVAECGSPVNISTGTSAMYCERNADEHLQAQEFDVLCCSGLATSDRRHVLSSDLSSGAVELQDHSELESALLLAKKPAGATYHSNERLSIDGYNWKKYGQKQLKNSENPRSYYKCTHPHCPAKRQVERSQEGDITEIMYKKDHNHAKPQGTRRGARSGRLMVEGDHHDTMVQNSIAVCKMNHDKASGDDSSLPMLPHSGLPETPEVSFTSPSNEEDEYGEEIIAYDDGNDDHDSKRRRIENEQEKRLRTTREPRVVVQTVSDEDVLDDGYRWRKYGQKVVKGHCYPRNYYRCTNQGCAVKKHAERSSSDVKSVITTYEGKHNHGVPAARGASRAANFAADSQSLASSYTDV